MPVATVTFTGFQPESVEFLAELAANNDRAWFQPRRAEYEELLKRPLEALCVALAERFAAAGIPLAADPARSPFRIYRDVRFSRDKSPYKAHVSASFPWIEHRDPDAQHEAGNPGGYFHLAPGEAFVGGGMWHPPKEKLAAFRRRLDQDPESVHAVLDDAAFLSTFGQINGDRLSRTPHGYRAEHPEAELLKLKDMTFGHRLSDEEVQSPRLPDVLVESFAVAVPVMRFFARLS